VGKDLSRRETLARLGGAAVCYGTGLLHGADETLAIGGVQTELRLTPISNTTLRVSLLSMAGDKEPQEIQDDPALTVKSSQKPLLKTRSVAKDKTLRWGQHRVKVSGRPLAVSIERTDGTAVQNIRIDDAGAISFSKSAGSVYGLGEGGPQFDRRNEQYTMRNGQFRPLLATIGARMPIPWLISADSWAIFFHQPYGTIDLTGDEYRFQPTDKQHGTLPQDFFVCVSNDPAELMKSYAELTGFPHMPPLWALGYQQSHRTLADRKEVMDEAKKFRDDQLPCDTMIYLGTGFCPSGWNTGHGSWTFNEKVFPDPKEMIRQLHDEHFHIILHLTMPPDNLHGTVSDTGAAAQDPNNAAHYWATHLDTLKLGVDGWWPDEGDKLPPESRLARNRMYWEGSIKDEPNKRPFALHRNGYAGLQRYGWLWSGDVDCTWKTLEEQIPVGLNTGLSGVPYWGTDTGGFVPTKELTGELYVRWFQFSAFTPLFRSHGRTWKLRLPWGWNTGDYGPIEVPESRMAPKEELHNAAVEPICKKYLDLRYRLLPYLYSLVRESNQTGMPVMRAMWLHYPRDSEAAKRGDQYLWGRDMLVAPVTTAAAKTRQVYLPEGSWYDFWSGEQTHGGKQVERSIDLATIPLYVRAGAVIPFGPVKQYVTEKSSEPMTLRVHPGADGEMTIYADDGESFAYERGEFMSLSVRWTDRKKQLRLALSPGSRKVWEGYGDLRIETADGREQKRVRFEGKALTVQI